MKVTYDPAVCVHNGQCLANLPEVFKVVDGEFTIHQQKASEDEIRKTVAACPSGALQIEEDDEGQ